jgi:hypothetical protein
LIAMTVKSLTRAAALSLAAVVSVVSAAHAQDPTPPPVPQVSQTAQRPGRGAAAKGQRDQTAANPLEVAQTVQDMLDNMVLSRSQGALGLTDDQYPLFFRRMQAFQRLQRRHQMQRLVLIRELNQLTKEGTVTGDDVLTARTKALDDLEADMSAQERQAMAAIDQTITIRQRARLRVFLENMDRTKITLIAQAMQAGGGPPAPGRGRK